MSKFTPAEENSNRPQKVLKSLEPMNTTTISITATLPGSQLIQNLYAAIRFIKALGVDVEYDVLIQVDKHYYGGENNVHTKDNQGADHKD